MAMYNLGTNYNICTDIMLNLWKGGSHIQFPRNTFACSANYILIYFLCEVTRDEILELRKYKPCSYVEFHKKVWSFV